MLHTGTYQSEVKTMLPHEVPEPLMRELLAAPNKWVATVLGCATASIWVLRVSMGLEGAMPSGHPLKGKSRDEGRQLRSDFVSHWRQRLAELPRTEHLPTSGTWRPVVGYEGLYEVSDEGMVRRIAPSVTCSGIHYMTPAQLESGYLVVTLTGGSVSNSRTRRVHQLVAEAFLGPCPHGKQVNHKDMNRTNNRAGNLEYLTPKENVRHAVENNPARRGEGKPQSKLSEANVRSIRSSRLRQQDLAELYGVTIHTIRDVVQRRTWTHLA